MNWAMLQFAFGRKSLMILDNAAPPCWLWHYCRWRWRRKDWGKLLMAFPDVWEYDDEERRRAEGADDCCLLCGDPDCSVVIGV